MIALGSWKRLQLQLAGSVAVGGALGALVELGVRPGWRASMLFAIPLALAGAPLSLSAGYLVRAMPLSRTPAPRLILVAVGSAAVAGALWAAAGYGWWQWLDLSGSGGDAVPAPLLLALVAGLGGPLYLFSVAMHYLAQAFEQSAEASRRMLASEVAHRDAELRALRAQVDPHFLFNSLHSIAALTSADSAGARAMCQRLADFLRESLAVGGSERIPLAREVGLAEQYLRVEQIRFGRRLDVSMSVAPELADVTVPPLILQPLVENAVRHGIATLVDGGRIEIEAHAAGEDVIVEVRNPKDPDAGRPGLGRGLGLVRQRLHGTFGDRAALMVAASSDAYRASIRLPRKDAH